jgi:hypothetical protein
MPAMADTEYDEIPVRLPSGTKAVMRLPRPFTSADARHLVLFLASYIEDDERPAEDTAAE